MAMGTGLFVLCKLLVTGVLAETCRYQWWLIGLNEKTKLCVSNEDMAFDCVKDMGKYPFTGFSKAS